MASNLIVMASNLEAILEGMASNLIAIASNLIVMVSNLEAILEGMASNLIAIASNLIAMASNLEAMASNLIVMASNLEAILEGMASNLIAIASNLIAMASNLEAMASNLIVMASNLEAILEGMASNLIAIASNLIAMASNLEAIASNLIAMASNLEKINPKDFVASCSLCQSPRFPHLARHRHKDHQPHVFTRPCREQAEYGRYIGAHHWEQLGTTSGDLGDQGDCLFSLWLNSLLVKMFSRFGVGGDFRSGCNRYRPLTTLNDLMRPHDPNIQVIFGSQSSQVCFHLKSSDFVTSRLLAPFVAMPGAPSRLLAPIARSPVRSVRL